MLLPEGYSFILRSAECHTNSQFAELSTVVFLIFTKRRYVTFIICLNLTIETCSAYNRRGVKPLDSPKGKTARNKTALWIAFGRHLSFR
jgi:hypothetical protein